MKLENPFVGVNPHLNSLLQTPGSDVQPSLWPMFHSAYINALADGLNGRLPLHYVAYAEQGLQLYSAEWDGRGFRRTPDVGVFQERSPLSGASVVSERLLAPEVLKVPLVEVFEVARTPFAVLIREVAEQDQLGRIVAWIEMLSPSNMSGAARQAYLIKRRQVIEGGIPLVEIDLLHEFPKLPGVPAYPDDPTSMPYAVTVADPRPAWPDGWLWVHRFGLAQALAAVTIPLAGSDEVALELDAAYQRVFVARRLATKADYSQPPVRFERYRADDQAWIRAQMEALRAGDDERGL